MADGRLHKVVSGWVHTFTAEGGLRRHLTGKVVELTDSEAKRLTALGAVVLHEDAPAEVPKAAPKAKASEAATSSTDAPQEG